MRKYFVFYLCLLFTTHYFCVATEPSSNDTESPSEKNAEPVKKISIPEEITDDNTQPETTEKKEDVSSEKENAKQVIAEESANCPPTRSTEADEPSKDLEDAPETKEHIIISEIQLGTSTSSHEEYIELYNPTDSDIDLANYSLKKYTSSKTCDDSPSILVSKSYFSGTIKSGDYFIITHQEFGNTSWADMTFSGKSYTIADNSAVVLYDDSDDIIDKVGFGDAQCFDENPAPNPQKNVGIERKQKDDEFVDTDNNRGDFVINNCPFPGNFLPSNIYTDIYINEIYPDPCDENGTDCPYREEFIEIYNPHNTAIDLTDWKIKDASNSYTITGNEKITIDEKTSTLNNISETYIHIPKSIYGFALNNSGGETVSLTAPNCKIVSKIDYDTAISGRSLNFAPHRWYWEKPTPSTKNRENPLTKDYPTLLLSEVLPNPSSNENTDEFIEIYNPNDVPVDLENWTIKDATKTGMYTFMEPMIIDPRGYFIIYRKDFSFALNNSNETVSLIAPNEKTVSTLMYKSSKENVSHNYHLNTQIWRQSKYLTPGKENVFNNLPEITKFDVDNVAYKDVYAEFETKASDKDREKLKVRWDFGDSHKSYLWKTRHEYENTGTYHGELRIQDESEEVTQNFTVEVKKYPKYEIKITKIVPNPAGKDTGNEYLIIKNESDKKINLKNWSIATGTKSKTLVNHPVYDDLYITPGKTKTIKKKHAAISLPNKKGVIEIRRPNGTVSDKKKYGDKNTSIPDNASYEKIDSQWQWIIPVDKEKQKEIDAIITQALTNEKMFSQQHLEREIAYNAIYNSKKVNDIEKNINKNNSSQNIFLTINQIINHLIIFAQENLKNIHIINTNTLQGAEIYKIKKVTNPCKNLHIPTQKKYMFCQK